MAPSVIVPTQPSARWTLLLTSPQKAPITRGLSRSCTTTIFGPGTLADVARGTRSRRLGLSRAVPGLLGSKTTVTA